MTRRLVGIDDDLLAIAQGALGTKTIKATVNEALRLAGASAIPGTYSLWFSTNDVLGNHSYTPVNVTFTVR